MKTMKRQRTSIGMLVCMLVLGAFCAKADTIEQIAIVADSQDSNFIQEALADRVYHLIRTSTG